MLITGAAIGSKTRRDHGPIRKPVVNSQLDGLNHLQRTTEAFRYTILCIEHWISPEETSGNGFDVIFCFVLG